MVPTLRSGRLDADVGPISVRVLGGPAVDGIDPRDFGSRKSRRLLELLALGRGRAVPFDVLTEELWPDRSPARPADQLAVLVSRLRALLGADAIERRDSGYLLHYGRLDLDDLAALTDEVDRRRTGGTAESAVVAARALSRLSLPAEPAALPTGRTPWAIDRSAEVSRLLARAVHAGMIALAAADQWPEAADAAARAIELDPFDEQGMAIRITALAATGRSGTALTEYHRFRRRLADELGVDPAADVQRLYRRLLQAPTGPTGTTGSTGPTGPTGTARTTSASVVRTGSLVGRRTELAALDVAGRSAGHVRVLVLRGEAGIGKTSLLAAWAAGRRAAGGTVLAGTCGPHDEAVPLDVVIVAVADHLRRRGGTTDPGPPARMITALAGMSHSGAATGPDERHAGTPLADGAPDPGVLFAALASVLAGSAPLLLILDNAYLGGPLLASFVDFIARRPVDLCVVVAVRPGEGEQFAGHRRLDLGPLDRAAAAALVGADRADLLFDRTQGHPLLLTELARERDIDALPAGLVESVARRCESLGPAGRTLRAAAVLGDDPDPELLSGVLGRPVLDVLADLELAADRHLVVDAGPTLTFRHDLVRQALAAGVLGVLAAGWHRAAAAILARRAGADPMTVAAHARTGGDRELAARWLGLAANRAAVRFDHPTAKALLDEAIDLLPSPAALLERARLHTLTGRYRQALDDLDASGEPAAAALEVRAWASYFDRRFGAAREAADDGAAVADDPVVLARCLMIGGRTRHAGGDLAGAENLLVRAADTAGGADRVTARAWLGILRAHQSRTDDALALLRPALRTVGAPPATRSTGVGPTAAVLHGLLFTGHAHALAGRPAAALHFFATYTDEVARRQVPRFAGRGINFGGWVLRNLGAADAGSDAHLQALEVADHQGTAEVRIAALLDLAEAAIGAGDPDAAGTRLHDATAEFGPDLVFGWRLAFKATLLGGRLALLTDDPETARRAANALAADAQRLGIPRYASVGRLLAHRAAIALGEPVDPSAVTRDLDLAEASVALESWWWAGELGAATGERAWLQRAQAGAARLLAQAGRHEETFRRHVDRSVQGWLSAPPAPPAG